MPEILGISTSDNPSVRTKALSFLLDNISDKYRNYDPRGCRHLAFVPAVLGSKKMLAKPFEVRDMPRSWFLLDLN